VQASTGHVEGLPKGRVVSVNAAQAAVVTRCWAAYRSHRLLAYPVDTCLAPAAQSRRLDTETRPPVPQTGAQKRPAVTPGVLVRGPTIDFTRRQQPQRPAR